MRLALIGGDGGISGVPTHLRQLVEALQERADITVFSDYNRGGYDFLTDSAARHVVLTGLRSGYNPGTLLRARAALRAQLGGGRFDLIWAHARMGVLLTRLAGRDLPPLVVSYHGLPFGPGHRWGGAWLERALLRQGPPQRLVFLSGPARDTLAQTVGARILQRHRTYVLPNCSDLGGMPARVPSQQGPVIVMTGRVGYQKNLSAAAPIFAALPANARLEICGTGTREPAFQARFCQKLPAGARARVRFHGPLRDVRPLLARADLYLMSSRYEGMPIGALEAMEAGLPVALPDIPGTQAILAQHPLAARLDLSDPGGAAAQIQSLLQVKMADPVRYARAIRAAWAAHFSPAVWRVGLDRLWQDLSAG